MSFFDRPQDPPEPAPRPRRPAWMGPPDGTVGQGVPLQVVLVRSEELLVVADRFTSYPSGFELRLSVRSRHSTPGPPPGIGMGPGTGPYRGRIPEEMLRFGVAFADGRKATNTASPFGGPGPGVVGAGVVTTGRGGPDGHPHSEPEPPVLIPRGGSGSDGRWDQGFWVWGLPPEGPLGLVVHWPAQGVAETRVDVDSAPLREAAARAEVVWDD